MSVPQDIMSYMATGRMLEPGRLVQDPAMLKILPQDKIRDIAVIAMRANFAAIQAYAQAQEQVIKEMETMKF
ncbi:MAG: hypothetical protein ABW092_03000 [Candidatus Thiodiazotropha sp.]